MAVLSENFLGGGVSSHMKIQLEAKFDDIVSLENLLLAWQEFVRGKRKKKDVQEFSLRLMDNIIELQEELVSKSPSGGFLKAFILDLEIRRTRLTSDRAIGG